MLHTKTKKEINDFILKKKKKITSMSWVIHSVVSLLPHVIESRAVYIVSIGRPAVKRNREEQH